jgi:hypothetical protein
MISYLDLYPTGGAAQRLHETSGRSLVSAKGLSGPTGARSEPWDRAEDHGVVEAAQQFMPARILILEGELWAATLDAVWTDWRLLAAAFYQALSADATVRFQEGAAGPQLEGAVRLAGDVLPPIEGNGANLNYQIMLRAADPVWYSQTEQTSATTGAPSSSGGIPFPIPFPIPFGSGIVGGSVSVVNGGNVETWPRIQLLGPASSPAFTNSTTGETITFEGLTITSAQTLVVETKKPRSAKVSGTSVAGSIRWSDSRYPRLAVGTNVIQFTASGTTAGTQMTVFWRDGYL